MLTLVVEADFLESFCHAVIAVTVKVIARSNQLSGCELSRIIAVPQLGCPMWAIQALSGAQLSP